MKTIEFEAKIENGMIAIPKNLQDQIPQYVKVIIHNNKPVQSTQQMTALEKFQAAGLVGCGQSEDDKADSNTGLTKQLLEIGEQDSALPVFDNRSSDKTLEELMEEKPIEQGNLIENLMKIHEIPYSVQRSDTEIEQAIQENRNSWD